MTIYADIIRDTVDDHAIIGRNLRRSVQVSGMRNTAGEPEVYRVIYNGTYNNGSIRADVQVQRPNGSFAMLNSNKHYQRISRVLGVLKEIGTEAEYLAANAMI